VLGAVSVAVTLAIVTLVPNSPTSNDDSKTTNDAQRKRRAEWVYTFPVGGPEPYYPRDHLHYPAADITGCRRLVRAPISGVIFDVRDIDKWDKKIDDPGTRGGLTITLHGDDNVRYYFSHLGRLIAKKGQRVESGQKIATVGDSGNAKVTRCHLHFGISRICPMSEQNLLRGEIWPQKYLDAWRNDINRSPNREVMNKTRREPAACLESAAAQRRGDDG
jgi:hypothetical protein